MKKFSQTILGLLASALTLVMMNGTAHASEDKVFTGKVALKINTENGANYATVLSLTLPEMHGYKNLLLSYRGQTINTDQEVLRQKDRGDGKIDVDIIIRIIDIEYVLQALETLPEKPESSKNILDGLDLILITVDNISGVYVDAPSTPGDVRIVYNDDLLTPTSPSNSLVEGNLLKPIKSLGKMSSNISSTSNNSIQVYPNPATTADEINFHIGSAHLSQLIVFNSIGSKIEHTVVNRSSERISIQLSNNLKGIFFAKIITNEGEQTVKFILK